MSSSTRKVLFVVSVLVLALLALTACAPAPAPTQTAAECPTAEPCPTCPEQTPCPEGSTVTVPFEDVWAASGHADAAAAAFVNWDEDDPAVVPANCAKCHTTSGLLDFVGADGSAAGAVDADHPIGQVVSCEACHNPVSAELSSVTFPSGKVLEGLGSEAKCLNCHQGRASKVQVDEAIAKAGLTDEDTPTAELGFVNIHYFSAAVSRYGKLVQGGYEYEGKQYDSMFDHVEGYQTCQDCHDPHSLQVKVDQCQACHTNVAGAEDLRNIRSAASLVDYDGDGDTEEGTAFELDGLREILYAAIQAYATEVAGTAIVYDSASYPYFFIDTNANGAVDEGEAVRDNRYNAWTARLEKAAFNFQTSLKDPGAYAHGGKYIIQLVYDSIESLNEKLATPVDLSTANRIDAGHFAGSETAFRYWDEQGAVPGSCAKCHSGGGLPEFLAEGVNISKPVSNGLYCSTCHNDVATFTRYEVGAVEFPSGAELEMADPDNNLCINCHQGRASKVTVDRAIADKDPNTADENLRFINIHYFAAGSTLFGTEAQGIYEVEGKTYLGKNNHVEAFANCTQCHETHALDVNVASCAGCHGGEDPALYRAPGDTVDYDGDADTTEGIAGEIATLQEALLASMQSYATSNGLSAIAYDSHAYPYYFIDTNANGVADPEEANRDNSYSGYSPNLLIGAYNYQYVGKDPGAFSHNGKYVIQVLVDTIELLGGDVAAYTRP